MTFRVFISSSMEDMYLVNDLKDTLERYGIQAIVPSEIILDPLIADNIKQLIQTSDCVLVIIGRRGLRHEGVDFEIGVATAKNKLIIPIVEEGSEIPKALINKPYIVIDRNQPKVSYERAAQYLNTLKIEKERRNAIGGLLLLGLGLLLLSALFSGD